MESLTTEEESKNYREKAIELCGQFIRGPWIGLKNEDIEFKEIIGGFINRVYIIEITKNIELNDETPRRVIIRFLERKRVFESENEENFEVDIKYVGEAAEAVVFNMLSTQKIGPKLLGVFPGGRIEEFIQSHHPSDEDFKDPRIYSGIARKLAQHHALDAPIPKENFYETKFLDKFLEDNNNNNKIDFNTIEDVEERKIASELLDIDLKAEVAWIKSIFKKYKLPVRLCHNDPQRMNILIKDNPVNDEDTIVLIDMDTVGYNIRGHEFGYHFDQMMFDARRFGSGKSIFNGLPYPDEDYRREFLSHYLNEWKNIAPIDKQSELDTVDHLLMESFFGTIVHSFILRSMLMSMIISSIKMPKLWDSIDVVTKFYIQMKKDFCQKYEI